MPNFTHLDTTTKPHPGNLTLLRIGVRGEVPRVRVWFRPLRLGEVGEVGEKKKIVSQSATGLEGRRRLSRVAFSHSKKRMGGRR
jgi:hypothetical protein